MREPDMDGFLQWMRAELEKQFALHGVEPARLDEPRTVLSKRDLRRAYVPDEQPSFAPSFPGHYRVDEHGQGWVYAAYPGWALPQWERVQTLQAEDRTGKQIEESFNEVIGDPAKDRLGKGAAEQLKDAASGSIKRQDSSKALGRAISRG